MTRLVLLPAVDVASGQAVRLVQGAAEQLASSLGGEADAASLAPFRVDRFTASA